MGVGTPRDGKWSMGISGGGGCLERPKAGELVPALGPPGSPLRHLTHT